MSRFNSGPLYYDYAVIAVIIDIVITGVLGIIFGIPLAASGGFSLVEQPTIPLEIELLFVVLGSTGTFLATFWLLKKVPDNRVHNISLFVLLSVLISLPIIIIAPDWWNSSDNLGINVLGTIVWLIIPYATCGIVGKK